MSINHSALSLDNPAYNASPRKGWGGYSNRVTLLGLISAGAGRRLLKLMMPGLSKEDHFLIGKRHAELALEHRSAWSDRAEAACQKSFARAWTFFDYRVSGIGREEFSEEDKEALRSHAHRGGHHHQLAIFHLMASGRQHQTALAICRGMGL